MSTHNLCFEQKYEKYQNFLSENFPFLVVKFSIYLNRHVFVMKLCLTIFVVWSALYLYRYFYCIVFVKASAVMLDDFIC